MGWGDNKDGKGDVFSPVSWDSAAKEDSSWAFSSETSKGSSVFAASVWDQPGNQTNYFSPAELTPIYGSVENNRSSFFTPNNSGDSWAFKSGENSSSVFTPSETPSFGFGDSLGFKADHDISYLENNRSKVFSVFSNTAAELDNYHAARSMKENRDANSGFSAPRNSESSSWAFSQEQPKETNSVFSPTQPATASNWAFSRSEPTASSDSSSWAFGQTSGNPFSEASSTIMNPFAKKK